MLRLVFGGSIATAGQSMLPNKLNHGKAKGYDYDKITHGQTSINDVTFTLQTPDIPRDTLLKNIQKFPNHDAKMLFQLEHDKEGIVFIGAISIADLIAAAQDENGCLELERNKHFGLSLQDIEGIRGTEFLGIIDMFWIIVGIEFAKWLMDVVHFVLFCVLICVPWRWAQCMYLLCKHKSRWYFKGRIICD